MYIWAILTVVVAVAGPFGTYRTLDLPLRLALAAVLIGISIGAAAAVRAIIVGVVGVRGFWRCALLTAGCLGLLVPSMCLLALKLPPYKMHMQMPGWWELSLFGALCSLSLSAYRKGTDRRSLSPAKGARQADLGTERAAEHASPRILDRIPDDSRGELLSISVRDHYVDVRTTEGEASLLMRLSDAIAETEGVKGAQVHRSHWVAWAAVTGAEKTITRLVLKLSDGTVVPVSKTYRSLVEDRLERLGIGSGSTVSDWQARASADVSISRQSSG